MKSFQEGRVTSLPSVKEISDSHEGAPMLLDSSVGLFVGHIISAFSGFGGDAFADVAFLGVAFDFSDRNGMLALGLYKPPGLLPQITVPLYAPWLVERNWVLAKEICEFVDDSLVVNANMYGPKGCERDDGSRELTSG